MSQSTISKIAELNDAFRKAGPVATLVNMMMPHAGRWNYTSGICDLGYDSLNQITDAIKAFDAFNEHNDPYGERDFGSLNHGGRIVFWKIDYYDRNLEYGSPDLTDPKVTCRVMTILLASEY